MKWAKPKEYSKSKIDWAGETLVNKKSSQEERDKALEVLDNWRAIHSYPMHVFKTRLKRVSEKMDREALAVQRLKRLPSILKKLQRRYNGNEPTMNLSQMQDIAGCRVVVSNVDLAKKIYKENYIQGDIKHKKVNEKDYINNPKEDGYRSIHLIYRYKSDKEGKKEYNGLLVEVQIRSKLQHLWATAIETVDFFTRQAIKSNEGEKEWADFFRLVSSAFAMMEATPFVPNTPTDEKELYAQIKRKEEELNVVSKMNGWARAMQLFDQKIKAKTKKKVKFFLLELDILGEKLIIKSYTKEGEQRAINEYSALEKRHSGNKEYDVVLVGAENSSDLRRAYPNYFVDTGEFLVYLQRIVNKYR